MYITSLWGTLQLGIPGKSYLETGDQTMGYPTKVQLISRPNNQQWYVNFPNALAQALELRKGETVEWEVESRQILVMVRREAPPGRKLKTVKPPRES